MMMMMMMANILDDDRLRLFNIKNEPEWSNTPVDDYYPTDIKKEPTEPHAAVIIQQCDICLHHLPNAQQLATHRHSHTFERTYTCLMCMFFMFNSKEELRRHMRLTHKCDKVHVQHECKICHKVYRHKHNLQKHVRTHTNRKAYRCDKCTKRFSRLDVLRQHQRVHLHSMLPYECEVCRLQFGTKNNLRRHLLTHIGEDPYEYRIRPNGYSTKRCSDGHMKIQYTKLPYNKSTKAVVTPT